MILLRFCLRAGDEQLELTDALLCADGPARSLVDLSPVPEHRRAHGGRYDGLNQGFDRNGSTASWRGRAAAAAGRGRGGAGRGGDRIVLAADVSPSLRPRMWIELCTAHDIRKVQLHGLRHTCVSLLLELGGHPRTVMEIVGHSAMEMTMNVYGHVNVDAQRAVLDHLDTELS